MTLSPREVFLQLPDRRVRGRWVGPAAVVDADPYAPTLVFLHEGLGCIELWRSFPEALSTRTGLRGFVFDRTGYGGSSAWPFPPGTRYLDIEANQVLPQVLDAAGIQACLVIGHGDGGTIALVFAAAQPPLLRAVVSIGAHAIIEPRTISSIEQARQAFLTTDLRDRLARYHRENVDGAFWLWADAWLAPGFQPMDAPARLPRVRVPVLALQGEQDEYGTVTQLHAIARGISGRCETRLMPGCGHGPHLQDEATLVEVIARFIATLWRGPATDTGAAARVGLLVLAGLFAGSPVVAAQDDSCSGGKTIFGDAQRDQDRTEDAVAAGRLRAAADADKGCSEVAIAALAVEGWVEARRLASVGGAPDQLARITEILKRLAAARSARPTGSVLAQLAAYADAALRAAVAAAQDERDEMQLYLTYARTLAGALRLAQYGRPWPLPVELVEAELWLEVDRFAEAREAFARVGDAALADRVALGTGRVMERLEDTGAACTAYRRATDGALAPAAVERAKAALARLNCSR
jgi:pimeloyl-ACP methyl ester carboxylesterase